MGFHVCDYCKNETSSGDVTLRFNTGRTWEMPDMILHYVAVHDYMPPTDFVNDILTGKVLDTDRKQAKGVGEFQKVGYLDGTNFTTWGTAQNAQGQFFIKLWTMMQEAAHHGNRRQTRSIKD